MKTAVIGLGVEGKKATISLLKQGFEVYATDLSADISLNDLDLDNSDRNRLTIELGSNEYDKIIACDSIVLSPGLWNSEIAIKLKKSGKLINEVLNNHESLFKIAITGTNGKTTTALILKDILENAGKKVLIGGNAGGGFSGYCDLILKTENKEYNGDNLDENKLNKNEDWDVMIIEVCDMTLDYCKYVFNIDLIGFTNMGNDHMNVHESFEKYKSKLMNFFKNKTIFINNDDINFNDYVKYSKEVIPYKKSDDEIKLIGEFNKLNVGLAEEIAKYMNISEEIIRNTVKNFEAVEGRIQLFDLNKSKIYIGKTDNSDAVKLVLDENNFSAVFIGTSRLNETHRLDILDEVVKNNPDKLFLFNGLNDDFSQSINRLNSLHFNGEIKILKTIEEVIDCILECSNLYNSAIFVGGNGQEKIINIQNRLKNISGN
ncbi:Mur ligase family protein [Methanobrevibacter filiformis]|uniref:UDP-N-acetylmuramoylalanine--D-glutamate ligase n=1 Tax=Methanobrevibacter filiformis TaxID=55758 RepID=A0A166AE18_9EURY|nr:Mur ligase family protein [Methanobrevibacter filiformis]KZX11914.1 UDP-N-acetylmuramoylalanine--D-glutamate ligase [Methanobrevibacter filiformis]